MNAIRLAIVVNSNPMNFINVYVHSLHWKPARFNRVKWITAHNCGKPKWHSFKPGFALKRGNFGPRHCLTKCTLENNLLNQNCWSWYHFFSGEDTSSTDTSYCIHILWEICWSVFIGPPCILHDSLCTRSFVCLSSSSFPSLSYIFFIFVL